MKKGLRVNSFGKALFFSHRNLTEWFHVSSGTLCDIIYWCLLFLSVCLSVKPRKGSTGHKHRLEAGAHGKCRLCSVLQSSPVCGSDGHTYSSKVRSHFALMSFCNPHSTFVLLSLSVIHNSVCFQWWKPGQNCFKEYNSPCGSAVLYNLRCKYMK